MTVSDDHLQFHTCGKYKSVTSGRTCEQNTTKKKISMLIYVTLFSIMCFKIKVVTSCNFFLLEFGAIRLGYLEFTCGNVGIERTVGTLKIITLLNSM